MNSRVCKENPLGLTEGQKAELRSRNRQEVPEIDPISVDKLSEILVQRIKAEILPELPEGTTVKDVLRMYFHAKAHESEMG